MKGVFLGKMTSFGFVTVDPEMKPCPFCGTKVGLTSLKFGSVYSKKCQDISAAIMCLCGLTFEKEWTEVRDRDGVVTCYGEDIVTAWNRRISDA